MFTPGRRLSLQHRRKPPNESPMALGSAADLQGIIAKGTDATANRIPLIMLLISRELSSYSSHFVHDI